MIDLSRDGDVFVLRMDHDENRFSPQMLDALQAALTTVADADGPRALVTTGTGKFFTNGLDLDWLGANQERLGWYLDQVSALFARVLTLPCPTAAAINGHAFGAGAMLALAHDHRNDIFASSAAAVGILFARMGHPWVDPLAGAVVSLIILHTGVEILRSATADLMDTVPGRELDREIRASLEGISGLLAIEEVHAHRFGPWLVANLTIGVDGGISVRDGHRIAIEVERRLVDRVEFMRRVYVHYHPVT